MSPTTRRTFLQQSLVSCGAGLAFGNALADSHAAAPKLEQLRGQVGITTSSLSGHLVAKPTAGKLTLLDLPKFMRDELDMKVIDLNTSAFASYEPRYLDRIREAAEKAGCLLTNLKMNQRGLDMNSPEQQTRRRAIVEYKRSITAAAHLGLRWARPLPMAKKPDWAIHVASYKELAAFGATKGVELLVENFGWMQSDPDSVVKLVKAVGKNVAACPDTGNWNSEKLRGAGLRSTFPIAVTCDFKARQLGPNGEHSAYDLKRCFDIGWAAGYRGPWCLEHANRDRKALLRELGWLRDSLRKWMAAAK